MDNVHTAKKPVLFYSLIGLGVGLVLAGVFYFVPLFELLILVLHPIYFFTLPFASFFALENPIGVVMQDLILATIFGLAIHLPRMWCRLVLVILLSTYIAAVLLWMRIISAFGTIIG